MIFADNTQTLAGLADNAGVLASDWRTEGQWGARGASLSAYAGKAVSSYVLYANQSTPAGSYTIDYADIAILSSDGTVTPVYYRRMGDALPVAYNPSGQTNLAASEVELTASPGSPQTNTTYYASDHLGSARILTVAGGWPAASDAFYPFGAEQTPPPGDNAYKFAGLDRDAESQQDHASFRQYAYIEGRWTTPDPYDGSYDITNPQSFNRYAYALNNPLTYIDPLELNVAVGTGGGGSTCANDPVCQQYSGGGGGGGGGCDPDDASCGGGGGFGYDPFFGGSCCGFLGQNDAAIQGAGGWYTAMVNGWYGLDPSETIYVGCTGPSLFDFTCVPDAASMGYFASGTGAYYSNPISALARGISGQAGWIGTPGGVGAFYGASLLGAAGSIFESFAALDSVEVGIGAPGYQASNLHFVYGVEGEFQQGLLVNGEMQLTDGPLASRAFSSSPFQLSVPVLSTNTVLGEAGSAVGNCFTAACSAILRGWW